MDGRTQQNASGTDDTRHDSGPRACPGLGSMATEPAIAIAIEIASTRLLATSDSTAGSGLASASVTVLADPDAASASTPTSTLADAAASRPGGRLVGSTANAAGRTYRPRPAAGRTYTPRPQTQTHRAVSGMPTSHAIDSDLKGPGPPHDSVATEHDVHASATAEASQDNGTALSGSISTVFTVLSWICVGIHSRRALPCPVCA